MRRRTLLMLASCSPLLSLLASCGGGQSTSRSERGSVRFTVHWPEPSRLIPAATNSLRFVAVVLHPPNGEIVSDRFVARQQQATSVLLLDDLPAVKVRIRVTAHASADGTGTALAAGSVEVDVPEGAISGQGITLTSRVTEVRVTPAAANVAVGKIVRLTASAFDAQGNMVVIRPDQWQWSIAPGTIASIAPGGDTAQVTGRVNGVAVASVVLPEAGLSASKNVTVQPPSLPSAAWEQQDQSWEFFNPTDSQKRATRMEITNDAQGASTLTAFQMGTDSLGNPVLVKLFVFNLTPTTEPGFQFQGGGNVTNGRPFEFFFNGWSMHINVALLPDARLRVDWTGVRSGSPERVHGQGDMTRK